MKYGRLAIALLVLTIADPVAGSTLTYAISAWIDGRSQLIIHDNTLQWEHFDFAAPGRTGSNMRPTIIGTTLNSEPILQEFEWVPEWPLPPPDDIRFHAFSSTFEGLSPSLPMVAMDINLVPVMARDSLTIVQQPTTANDHTLVLEFDDNGPGGATWYTALVEVDFQQLLADFDEDGDVDGDDFLIWQMNFGLLFCPTGGCEGDADGDGDTDGDDFLIWQAEFGSGNGSASAAVPEPASVVLILAALVGAALCRPARNHRVDVKNRQLVVHRFAS